MRPLAFQVLLKTGIKRTAILLLIVHWRKDVLLIQLLRYFIRIAALQIHPEDRPHHLCSFFVYLQLIFITPYFRKSRLHRNAGSGKRNHAKL